jgi:hypothetical protein
VSSACTSMASMSKTAPSVCWMLKLAAELSDIWSAMSMSSMINKRLSSRSTPSNTCQHHIRLVPTPPSICLPSLEPKATSRGNKREWGVEQ